MTACALACVGSGEFVVISAYDRWFLILVLSYPLSDDVSISSVAFSVGSPFDPLAFFTGR